MVNLQEEKANDLNVCVTVNQRAESVEEKLLRMGEAKEAEFPPTMERQESPFFRPIEESEETRVQYAKVGLDIHTLHRFKSLATTLVVEKEAQNARDLALGNEKDVIMEESIECVPKNFLDEISFEKQALAHDALRVLSVGELLSLLEV